MGSGSVALEIGMVAFTIPFAGIEKGRNGLGEEESRINGVREIPQPSGARAPWSRR